MTDTKKPSDGTEHVHTATVQGMHDAVTWADIVCHVDAAGHDQIPVTVTPGRIGYELEARLLAPSAGAVWREIDAHVTEALLALPPPEPVRICVRLYNADGTLFGRTTPCGCGLTDCPYTEKDAQL